MKDSEKDVIISAPSETVTGAYEVIDRRSSKEPPRVYVVLSCPKHGSAAVEGVFDTKAGAEAFVAGFHPDWCMEIEERVMRRATESESEGK